MPITRGGNKYPGPPEPLGEWGRGALLPALCLPLGIDPALNEVNGSLSGASAAFGPGP